MTRQDLNLQAGQTYFFVARDSKRKNAYAATASTGLLGLALTTAITSTYDNPGPLDFFPLEESAAKATIADFGWPNKAQGAGIAPSNWPQNGPYFLASGRKQAI